VIQDGHHRNQLPPHFSKPHDPVALPCQRQRMWPRQKAGANIRDQKGEEPRLFRLIMVLNEVGEIYQSQLGTTSHADLLHGVERLPCPAK